jgi:hypothetical protein
MKRKRFTEEQIIGILKEAEQAGNIREVCRLHNLCGTDVLSLAQQVWRHGCFGSEEAA